MKDILKEYAEAVTESIEASKLEDSAKLRKKKAYYKLLDVKQRLAQETQELLNSNYVIN